MNFSLCLAAALTALPINMEVRVLHIPGNDEPLAAGQEINIRVLADLPLEADIRAGVGDEDPGIELDHTAPGIWEGIWAVPHGMPDALYHVWIIAADHGESVSSRPGRSDYKPSIMSPAVHCDGDGPGMEPMSLSPSPFLWHQSNLLVAVHLDEPCSSAECIIENANGWRIKLPLSAKQGENRVVFDGVNPDGQRIPDGTYRAWCDAVDLAGNMARSPSLSLVASSMEPVLEELEITPNPFSGSCTELGISFRALLTHGQSIDMFGFDLQAEDAMPGAPWILCTVDLKHSASATVMHAGPDADVTADSDGDRDSANDFDLLFPLYNDGQHDDGSANDDTFGTGRVRFSVKTGKLAEGQWSLVLHGRLVSVQSETTAGGNRYIPCRPSGPFLDFPDAAGMLYVKQNTLPGSDGIAPCVVSTEPPEGAVITGRLARIRIRLADEPGGSGIDPDACVAELIGPSGRILAKRSSWDGCCMTAPVTEHPDGPGTCTISVLPVDRAGNRPEKRYLSRFVYQPSPGGTIDPVSGGRIMDAAGSVYLDVPPHAVDEPLSVTGVFVDSRFRGKTVRTICFKPENIIFACRAELSLPCDDSKMMIWVQREGKWIPLGGKYDPVDHMVKMDVERLNGGYIVADRSRRLPLVSDIRTNAVRVGEPVVISFRLSDEVLDAAVDIFDIRGRPVIRSLVFDEGRPVPGDLNHATWNSAKACGLYICRVRAWNAERSGTARVVLGVVK